MDQVILFALGVSLLGNVLLGARLIKKKHILNVDAKALLSELLSGSALVKIQVLDPDNLFYRSPRR